MLKRFIILLVIFFTSSACFADVTRNFDVQVLIFSHLTPQTLQSEEWPLLSQSTIDAITANTNTTSITQHGAWSLQHEKNVLEKNPNYAVLFDRGFECGWQGDGNSVTLPISNGTQLNGTITIELDSFFNVHANLLLTEPISLLKQIASNNYFAQFDQSNFSFHLEQNRRMKSDELDYLGHPLMGILIKIIPG